MIIRAMASTETLLVLRLRQARAKARSLAEQEAVALLRDLGAAVALGGPFAEERAVAWITLPSENVDRAAERLPRLGYTEAVDVLTPPTGERRVRWRKRDFGVERIYEEHTGELRNQAVDRRSFRISTPEGVRTVLGYRGDGGPLSRRGLPVPDARLLANLVRPVTGGSVLDPFAGAGGVVIELQGPDVSVFSMDIDHAVAPGLSDLSHGRHLQASAAAIPLRDGCIDGIATETPFDPEADRATEHAFREMHRCLAAHGRIAVMAPERQAMTMRTMAAELGLQPFADAAVDRKGVPVSVVAWAKTRLS